MSKYFFTQLQGTGLILAKTKSTKGEGGPPSLYCRYLDWAVEGKIHLRALRNCPERNNPERNNPEIFSGSSPSLVPFPLT